MAYNKYMQISKKSSLSMFFGFSFLAIMFSLFFSISVAHATVTPTLSLLATGSGDSVQLNITGDPSASVFLVYVKSGSGQQIVPIGTTNSNGTLTTTVSTASYSVPPGSTVHVILDNINGPQSSQVYWPAAASLVGSTNILSLSQTGLVLPLGQTSTITANNLNGSSIYLSNNSNPLIANFNISGSQISVVGNGYGSTTGTICLVNNTSNCVSVYVIVQNSSAQPLTFSQSSVSLSAGQSLAIQISGGNGSYSVLSNSVQNSGIVTTSISGSIITLATNSTTGSSSITVCSTDMSSCGIINVAIGNTANSTTTLVSFSQQNPTVTIGQNLNISIYGPTSSLFYVSSNSNPSIVQANLSGSTLTLLGIANGTSTISICASSSNCASLTVTINPNYSSNGGNITLSQDNVTLSVGQNVNVTVSGGAMPYNTLLTPNNIFQASLNSNILTIYGESVGVSSMSVCSNGSCSSINVTVTGQNSVSTSFSLPAGCYSTVGYSQTTGLSCSSVTNVTIPSDCTGALYSVSTGQACPADTVIPPISTVITTTPSSTSSSSTSSAYVFTKYLILGSTGTQVSELQTKLKSLGYYKGKIDGGFGSVTEAAVKAYQKAHGLPQVGTVGPRTRALLNK